MRGRNARTGFTLIEILAVVAIILILSGILLKTTTLIFRNMAVGKAQHDLQQLQNALNEYYNEYGSYPPVNFLAYEYEGPYTRQILTVPWLQMFNDPVTDPTNFVADMDRSGFAAPGVGGRNLGYRYGLVSYLWRRDGGPPDNAFGLVHWRNDDTARDKIAKAKWAGFLAEVTLSDGGGGVHIMNLGPGATKQYTNSVLTIYDPWSNEYQYRSDRPYQSYRLSSNGPDGSPGTPDDINADSTQR